MCKENSRDRNVCTPFFISQLSKHTFDKERVPISKDRYVSTTFWLVSWRPLKHGCLAFLRTPALFHIECFMTQNLKADLQWVQEKFFLYINQSLQRLQAVDTKPSSLEKKKNNYQSDTRLKGETEGPSSGRIGIKKLLGSMQQDYRSWWAE